MQARLHEFDERFRINGKRLVGGVDEAGRGPLAGPVVAAACIFKGSTTVDGINDSKQLTPSQRERIFRELITCSDVIYGVGVVDHEVIDEINILQATIRAMQQAVFALAVDVDVLLVDGLALPGMDAPVHKVIKGDAQSLCIAAASIIAKETRDRLMLEYHEQWPDYGFASHKGYGTQKHREAIKRLGPCPIHRRTFEPIKSMYSQALLPL